jgi:cytidine deaminase
MHAGNEIRRVIGHADAMARIALSEIHNIRETLNDDRDASVPAEGNCFIVSSLKRSEELETLRRLFGQRVLLASVYEPKVARIDNLCRNIARSRNSPNPESFCDVAEEIIATDQKEHSNPFGQRLEDVFQTADVFLAAGKSLREDVRRFVQLLFRAPYITPSVDESLMVQARSAAHRSADLSRQVGAGGGVLWDDVAGTERDYRDYKFGQDPAAGTRKDIVAEVLQALADDDWLVTERKGQEKDARAQSALFLETKPLAKTAVANLLEFGRIVHAEMAAICDAAARGVPIRDSTLYCTTFPCHLCARLIIASGITRVVYIEPYAKSRAKQLYKRAIRVDHDDEFDSDAVNFEAFVGVSPARFFDLFQMVSRKDEQGYALKVDVHGEYGPKGVEAGSLAAELESSYVASIGQADWSKLQISPGEVK